MITTGKFERSSCYWGKYVTLSGESRLLHANSLQIKAWSNRMDTGTDLTSKIVTDYFHSLIKTMVDSATYSRNIAKLERVHLARDRSNA